MVYKVAGGLFFLFSAASLLGIYTLPAVVLGIIALVAGIALLAGY